MRAFSDLCAVAVPMLRENIDTDAIIPSREIRSVSKSGLADGLFADWRYSEASERVLNPEFVLNQPAFHGAQILLAGPNFGCGSSREHAVWALAEFGFRVLLAPSFNPIFLRNCVRNGLVAGSVATETLQEMAANIASDPQANRLSVQLTQQRVGLADRHWWHFDIAADVKDRLLSGLDSIDETLRLRTQIDAFQAKDRRRRPWIY